MIMYRNEVCGYCMNCLTVEWVCRRCRVRWTPETLALTTLLREDEE